MLEGREDGTIEGATNLPLGHLIRNARQGKMDDLRGKTVCTYCNGGYRGNIGADELGKAGFDAITIESGYSAWKKAAKKSKWILLLVTDIYHYIQI